MKRHNCWDFKNPDVYHQAFGSDASLHQIDTIAQSLILNYKLSKIRTRLEKLLDVVRSLRLD